MRKREKNKISAAAVHLCLQTGASLRWAQGPESRPRRRHNLYPDEIMRLNTISMFAIMMLVSIRCSAQDWSSLWKSYCAAFMDNQIRVIDHDAGDRTTSEGQAYAMFFALVANDRARFDGLLRWTELNLAAGDLTAQLPAWQWGRDASDRWGVLDANAAADADVRMAYALLEAGRAWNEQHYRSIGRWLAQRLADEDG